MEDLARSVTIHKALAHPVRQRLLAMLRGGPLCVCQMTAVVELAASTVSSHLAELKRAGLLTESKEGRFVSYRWPAAGAVRRLLAEAVERIRQDPQVDADALLVRSLRRIGPDELCRVESDLSRVGIRRPARCRPVEARSGRRARLP